MQIKKIVRRFGLKSGQVNCRINHTVINKKLRDFIKKNIDGKKVLILFILTNILYVIMLTITIPNVMSYAGGMKLLDMIPSGYTSEYVNLLLNALGNKGRHAYLFNQIPLDMVYPFLFGISSCLVLAYFLASENDLFSHRLFVDHHLDYSKPTYINRKLLSGRLICVWAHSVS